MGKCFYEILLLTTGTGVLLLSTNSARASLSTQEPRNFPLNSLIAVEFQLPGDSVPKTSIGGGIRGQVQFALPGGATPNSSISGGTRGNVQFALPGGATPNSSISGGTRGDVQFTLPSGATPNSSISGGTRGDVQFTLPGGATPNSSISGGTRGDVQFTLPGGATPNSSISGGTRGDVQFTLPGGATPNSSISGGTRGDVQFTLPGGATPNSSISGGTRGDVQLSLPGGATPNTSISGGTRGDVQLSLPGGATPNTSISGGTRGDVQLSLPEETAPDTAIRDNAQNKIFALTAIVPPTKHGRTLSARPTIYAYLPPIGAQKVFFSLQDEQGNPHYYAILKVSPQGGVLSITLPAEAPALEVDKNYLWYLAPIEPGGILRPDNYAVTGWVKRIEVKINEQAFPTSPVKLATEYAKAGLWYDTLKVLVEAKRAEPTNKTFATEWHDLLEQVGLEAISSQPLTEAEVINQGNLLSTH